MVRKIGQMIRRGPSTRLVRIYVGRDPETPKRSTCANLSWWAAERGRAFIASTALQRAVNYWFSPLLVAAFMASAKGLASFVR